MLSKRSKTIQCAAAKNVFWTGMKLMLVLALFISLFSMIIVVVQCVFCDGWTFLCNKDGVQNMITFWTEYKSLLVIVFSCTTLLVAMTTLQKHIDLAACQCICELKKQFDSPEKKMIHHYLLPPEDKPIIIQDLDMESGTDNQATNSAYKMRYGNVEVLDYLGILETGAIMLKRGLISHKDFANQFGYRLENCMRNEYILKLICRDDNRPYYDDLFYAVREMEKYNRK